MPKNAVQKIKLHFSFVLFIIFLLIGATQAADRGPVTNLQLPRFVSLKASKANARRGPSLSHRIDWVFKRKHMPLEVYAEYENWRKVRDIDGAGGWIHYSLLSGARTAVFSANMQNILSNPTEDSIVIARVEKNVVAKILRCELNWCLISTGGYKGWAPKTSLWGVYKDEIKN